MQTCNKPVKFYIRYFSFVEIHLWRLPRQQYESWCSIPWYEAVIIGPFDVVRGVYGRDVQQVYCFFLRACSLVVSMILPKMKENLRWRVGKFGLLRKGLDRPIILYDAVAYNLAFRILVLVYEMEMEGHWKVSKVNWSIIWVEWCGLIRRSLLIDQLTEWMLWLINLSAKHIHQPEAVSSGALKIATDTWSASFLTSYPPLSSWAAATSFQNPIVTGLRYKSDQRNSANVDAILFPPWTLSHSQYLLYKGLNLMQIKK